MATPTVWTEAPDRTPRTNTLLDLVGVKPFPEGRTQAVEYLSDNCEWPMLTPQDCFITIGDAQGTEKTFGSAGTDTLGPLFGAYAGIECFINGGLDEMRESARERLENGQSHVVEEAAITEMAASATGVGAGVDPIFALSALEEALAENVNAQGVIWVSPAAATHAAAANLLIRDPITGNLTTYLGTPVIVSTALVGVDVAYASGPVTVWGGDIQVTDGYALTLNTVKVLAERLFSVAMECGSWHYNLTLPVASPTPPEEDVLEMALGLLPASPIPVGTDTTATVQTNVNPSNEVYLWYAVNGGTAINYGEMTEVGTLEFVENIPGGSLGLVAGDSVEVWATSEYDGADVESNHIVVEITA